MYLAQRGSQTSASTLNLRGFPGSLTRHTRDLSGKSLSSFAPSIDFSRSINLNYIALYLRRNNLTVDSTSEDGSIFRPYRPISNEQISQVIALQECLNTNTLGQLWTSSLPFLYPFIVQFRLVFFYFLRDKLFDFNVTRPLRILFLSVSLFLSFQFNRSRRNVRNGTKCGPKSRTAETKVSR